MMNYKGYTGRVEFDDESGIFHGEVLGLKDVITVQGRSVDELEKAFRESIDDYLEFCEGRDEESDRARQEKVAHLQRLVDEGLESGVSDMTMADIRNAAMEKFLD